MSIFQGAVVLTRPAVEYGMWRHSEGACPPAQNFPRLIQAREIIFDAATFALLVYLTYRIDFLLKFQVSFNPDRPFQSKYSMWRQVAVTSLKPIGNQNFYAETMNPV